MLLGFRKALELGCFSAGFAEDFPAGFGAGFVAGFGAGFAAGFGAAFGAGFAAAFGTDSRAFGALGVAFGFSFFCVSGDALGIFKFPLLTVIMPSEKAPTFLFILAVPVF
jgi:hypothetical protein